MDKQAFYRAAASLGVPTSLQYIITNNDRHLKIPDGYPLNKWQCEQLAVSGQFDPQITGPAPVQAQPQQFVYHQNTGAPTPGLTVVPVSAYNPEPVRRTRKKNDGGGGINGIFIILILLIIAAIAYFWVTGSNSDGVTPQPTETRARHCPQNYKYSSYLQFESKTLQKDKNGDPIKGGFPVVIPTLKDEPSCISFLGSDMDQAYAQNFVLQGPSGEQPYSGQEVLANMIRKLTAKEQGKDAGNAEDQKWSNDLYFTILDALDPKLFKDAGNGIKYLILPSLTGSVIPPEDPNPTSPSSTEPPNKATQSPQETASPDATATPEPTQAATATPAPAVQATVPAMVTIWDLAPIFESQGWTSLETKCVPAAKMNQVVEFSQIKVDLTTWLFAPFYTEDRCNRLGDGTIKIENQPHFGDNRWIQMGKLWIYPSGCNPSGCEPFKIADRDLPRDLYAFVDMLRKTGADRAVSDGHDKFNWLMRYTGVGQYSDYMVLNTVKYLPSSCTSANKITVSTTSEDTNFVFVDTVGIWIKCEK